MDDRGDVEVIFIGDIGGQVGVFRELLAELGIDPYHPIVPEGQVLVQVGDVVRMTSSPDVESLACEQLADRLIELNERRYVQLLGNHDLGAIGGPRMPGWSPPSPPELGRAISRWWRTGRARLAMSFVDQEGEHVLVSHAGLTQGYWDSIGRPTAPDAARALNALLGQDLSSVLRPGRLVSGGTRLDADVAWAEVCLELLEPWLERGGMPFRQLHGHASPWSWQNDAWWADTPASVRAATTVDGLVRRSVTRVGSLPSGAPAWLESLDWALGDLQARRTWPLRRVKTTWEQVTT